jgi:hypothetical protein
MALLSCLAPCCVLHGQINTGTIVGVVHDAQGLVVAGAEVALTSERTGDIRRTVTNEEGAFTLPAVPTGTYALRVSTQVFQTFERWFNTGVFARPAKGDWGNAPKDVFRGPGLNNWDISLLKNIPLKSELRVLQFRSEF